MGVKTGTTPLESRAGKRPVWLRLLIFAGIAFVAVNVLAMLVLSTGSIMIGFLGHFAIALGIAALVARPRGGLNLLRTWSNPPTADFTRRDDPTRSGYIYDVRPARASRMAILLPLPLAAFLALWGVFSVWIFYAAMALYFIVIGTIVLPGARDRKPATIAVSPRGIEAGDVQMPLDRIVDLDVHNSGVKVSREPLMPGRNGVSTSGMVGRGLGHRQAARSFALTLRGDGDSHATVIAGGLTEACAENLHRDICNAVETFRAADKA